MVSKNLRLNNKNGVKLKEPQIRQKAYKEFCKHLEEGWPKEAFFFEYGEHHACWKTVERYIEENPLEFPPHLLNKAMAQRFKHWFGEGKTLMKGGYVHGSPETWKTIMRNMFKKEGWDQQDLQSNNKPSESIRSVIADTKDLDANNRILPESSQIAKGGNSSS